MPSSVKRHLNSHHVRLHVNLPSPIDIPRCPRGLRPKYNRSHPRVFVPLSDCMSVHVSEFVGYDHDKFINTYLDEESEGDADDDGDKPAPHTPYLGTAVINNNQPIHTLVAPRASARLRALAFPPAAIVVAKLGTCVAYLMDILSYSCNFI